MLRAEMAAGPAVSVTNCGPLAVPICWVGKVRLDGDTPRFTLAPCPLSAIVRGLPGELSVIVSVPVRVPVVVGVNVTGIAQLVDAAILVQVFD